MNLSKVIITTIICWIDRRKGRIPAVNLNWIWWALLTIIQTPLHGQRKGNTPDFDRLPSVAWRFACATPIIGSPIIDEEVVYFGAEDSTWYALGLGTGRLMWKLKTHAAIRSSPVLQDNHVFLVGGNGILTCVDKATGAIVWRTVFDQTAQFMGERNYDFADYYHSSPLIDNGIVYLGTGNGTMSAFKASTGEILWRYQAADIIHGRAVIAADKVIFGCFDGKIYALDRSSGQCIWKFKTNGHRYFPKGEVQGDIATDGKNVFVGSRDYNFYALNAATGTANWTKAFPNGWAMSSTVADTVAYIGTSDDRVMVAADTKSGREHWRTDVRLNVFGGCALTSGALYFGTIWGKVYALDRKTGKIMWTFETQGYKDHHVKFFDANDRFRPDIGNILKSPFAWIAAEHLMGGIFSTPAVSGDMMVITTTEGIVYGLKR